MSGLVVRLYSCSVCGYVEMYIPPEELAASTETSL